MLDANPSKRERRAMVERCEFPLESDEDLAAHLLRIVAPIPPPEPHDVAPPAPPRTRTSSLKPNKLNRKDNIYAEQPWKRHRIKF